MSATLPHDKQNLESETLCRYSHSPLDKQHPGIRNVLWAFLAPDTLIHTTENQEHFVFIRHFPPRSKTRNQEAWAPSQGSKVRTVTVTWMLHVPHPGDCQHETRTTKESLKVTKVTRCYEDGAPRVPHPRNSLHSWEHQTKL